jgi:hypothetical protein
MSPDVKIEVIEVIEVKELISFPTKIIKNGEIYVGVNWFLIYFY